MAIVDVIKFNGNPDVFAWKYPSEELGTWSQLIVNESQEAILFKGGKALDVFGSGRHTLDTSNIPVLRNLINLPFGGRSPFTAEVWFVNKSFSLDIKWGTPTPIQLQDPKYGVFVPVRSHGIFGIKIEESKKFLMKLVGTLSIFDKASILKYFRGLYVTKVKDAISSYLVHKQISILEINAYLDELSTFLKERIESTMQEYGIQLLNFYVNDISVPEDDLAVKKLKEALAKRAEMNIIGYNYQQERSFDTMEGAAKNQGSASAPVMGAGLGLGMGVGLGGKFGSLYEDITSQLNAEQNSKKICPTCREQILINQRFCGTCGNLYNPCPSCETNLPEGATNCSKCGHILAVKCGGCGAIVVKGAKFCQECGTLLVKKCSKCNSTLEGNPKFCPECGENLK